MGFSESSPSMSKSPYSISKPFYKQFFFIVVPSSVAEESAWPKKKPSLTLKTTSLWTIVSHSIAHELSPWSTIPSQASIRTLIDSRATSFSTHLTFSPITVIFSSYPMSRSCDASARDTRCKWKTSKTLNRRRTLESLNWTKDALTKRWHHCIRGCTEGSAATCHSWSHNYSPRHMTSVRRSWGHYWLLPKAPLGLWSTCNTWTTVRWYSWRSRIS